MVRPDDESMFSVYHNSLLCHIFGRFTCLHSGSQAILLSLFNVLKARLYAHLSDDSHPLRKRQKYMEFILAIAFLMLILLIGCCNSGPNTLQYDIEIKVCSLQTFTTFFIIVGGAVLFFTLNLYVLYVFCYYGDLDCSSMPQLQYQFWVNKHVVPIMFFSTVFVYSFQLCYTPGFCPISGNMVLYIHHAMLLDSALNVFVMYVSLYHSSFHFENENMVNEFFDENITELGEASTSSWGEFIGQDEDNSSMEVELSTDESYLDQQFWISIPGAHPIKATMRVIRENRLEQFIVSKKKRLRAIKKYQERGFIPSLLMCCCATTADLDNGLHDMGVELGTGYE